MAIGKIARRVEGVLPTTTKEYIANADNYMANSGNPFDISLLKKLTLDDLVLRYKEIDYQSQLFKGQVLLEARERFQSNIGFGKWLSVNFTELNSSNTGKLINLAKYFQGEKTLKGIPISAAYLIASPNNKEIADKIYKKIKHKNLKIEAIKQIIAGYKSLDIDSQDRQEKLADQDVIEFSAHLLENIFSGKKDFFIKSVLMESLQQLNNRKK
jgi:hypothetical protein